MDDFDEFCSRVGTEVPIYRTCHGCGDLCIVDPERYQKPKTECDPDTDCPHWLPMCICTGRIIFDIESVSDCTYPDCACSPNYD